MSKAFKRLSFSKEPFLHAHRYIVTVGCHKKSGEWQTKFYYCENRDEVRAVKNKVPVGAVIEVFKAEHNFHQAWERVK